MRNTGCNEKWLINLKTTFESDETFHGLMKKKTNT